MLNKKNLKIISLFDGISGCQQAFKELGIEFDGKDNIYFASEIDKNAIKITQKNFPNTIQLGDVKHADTFLMGELVLRNLISVKKDLQEIFDLVCFGSPCQDLSLAKRNREGLDGSRSNLFYEAVRILKKVKPRFFIMENVASMSKESREIISKELGVDCIMIDSAKLTAQSRKRLYWVSERIDFCEKCNIISNKQNNYYNNGTKENTAILGKTSYSGKGEGSGKSTKYCEDMQSLQENFPADRSPWNNQNLFYNLSINQQKEQRQEQKSREIQNYSKDLVSSQQGKNDRVQKELSPKKPQNFFWMGTEENKQSYEETICCNERCLEKEQQKNQFNRESGIIRNCKEDEQRMCILPNNGKSNGGSYNTNNKRWNQSSGKSSDSLQKLQFSQERQNNGGISSICKGCNEEIPIGYKQVFIWQPQDQGIMLKDILESGVTEKEKSYCMTSTYSHACHNDYFHHASRQHIFEPICVASRGRNIIDGKRCDIKGTKTEQRLEPRLDGKTNTLTTVEKDNLILESKPIQIASIGKNNMQGYRVYSINNKSITLSSNSGGLGGKTGLYKMDLPNGDYIVRKLTPIEAERLQGFSDGYTYGIATTNRYKALGNSFTVPIISHILKHLFQ